MKDGWLNTRVKEGRGRRGGVGRETLKEGDREDVGRETVKDRDTHARSQVSTR